MSKRAHHHFDGPLPFLTQWDDGMARRHEGAGDCSSDTMEKSCLSTMMPKGDRHFDGPLPFLTQWDDGMARRHEGAGE